MTILATASDGWTFIGIGALLLLACAGPGMLAWWVVSGKPAAGRIGALALVAATIACVASGTPGLVLLVVAAGIVAYVARQLPSRGGRIAAGGLIVAAGLPVYAITLFIFLIGFAAFGCAPDAYECPI